MALNDQAFIELFKRAAWEVDQKRLDRLSLDAKISELGIDSVAMLELMGFLEEELGIQIPDEKIARVTSLRELSMVIEEVDPNALVRAAS